VLTYNAEISFMDSYLTYKNMYYRAKRRAEISNKEIDNFTFIDKTPCERKMFWSKVIFLTNVNHE
jgi:hypothetical protein